MLDKLDQHSWINRAKVVSLTFVVGWIGWGGGGVPTKLELNLSLAVSFN